MATWSDDYAPADPYIVVDHYGWCRCCTLLPDGYIWIVETMVVADDQNLLSHHHMIAYLYIIGVVAIGPKPAIVADLNLSPIAEIGVAPDGDDLAASTEYGAATYLAQPVGWSAEYWHIRVRQVICQCVI